MTPLPAAAVEELRLAREELIGAEQLISAKLPRIALTRAYFAAFHAGRGLLLARDLEPKTHEGVQHLINLHFVKTGVLEPGTSRLLARLQKFREAADYSEAFVVDVDGAREELEAARGFVGRVEVLLSTAV